MAGLFISGVSIVMHVLTTELVGPSKRGIVCTMPSIAFSSGIAALSLTAWFIHNWRTMTAVLSAFGIIVVTPAIYWHVLLYLYIADCMLIPSSCNTS